MPARWLPDYHRTWLSSDAIAGVTLAAYAIPVSLAYAVSPACRQVFKVISSGFDAVDGFPTEQPNKSTLSARNREGEPW